MGFAFNDAGSGDEEKLTSANPDRPDFKGVGHEEILQCTVDSGQWSEIREKREEIRDQREENGGRWIAGRHRVVNLWACGGRRPFLGAKRLR
jgi:hypothetical protein